jgi:hypothetical protein
MVGKILTSASGSSITLDDWRLTLAPLDHPKVPPIPSRLSLVRLLLEVSLFAPALVVLQGIISADDEEVEAWYLDGWCYFLMAEQSREDGGSFDDMTSQELAQEACNRLERCKLVRTDCRSFVLTLMHFLVQLHVHQRHPDMPLLEHTKELIAKLESMGCKPAPLDEVNDDADDWEEVESSDDDGDGDIEMS